MNLRRHRSTSLFNEKVLITQANESTPALPSDREIEAHLRVLYMPAEACEAIRALMEEHAAATPEICAKLADEEWKRDREVSSAIAIRDPKNIFKALPSASEIVSRIPGPMPFQITGERITAIQVLMAMHSAPMREECAMVADDQWIFNPAMCGGDAIRRTYVSHNAVSASSFADTTDTWADETVTVRERQRQ